MSGAKGGSQTTSVEVPEYIERAAQRNLNRADKISKMGYVPYYGPDVAAFSPMQQSAFQNTADTASAFGMASPSSQQDIMGGMPAPTTYAGGVQGYSSAPMFEQAQDELARRRPAQKSYIDSFFIDPYSGSYGSNAGLTDYTQMGTAADERAAQRANDLAIARAQADPSMAIQPDPEIFGNMSPEAQRASATLATDPSSPTYNDSFNTVFNEQSADASKNPYGQSTGFGVTTDILDATGVDTWLPPKPTVTTPEGSFGADLKRSLTDPNYDPEGTVFSRVLGLTKVEPKAAPAKSSTKSTKKAVDKMMKKLAPDSSPRPKARPKKSSTKSTKKAVDRMMKKMAPSSSPRPKARPKKTSGGGGGK